MAKAASVPAHDPGGFARSFADHLVGRGLLDELSVRRALAATERSGERLTVVLARLGLVSEADLARALSEHLSLHLVGRDDLPAEPMLPDRLDAAFLKAQQVLPLSLEDGTLRLAMTDPTADEVCLSVAYHLDCAVERAVISPADFSAGWERLYGSEEKDRAQVDAGNLIDLDVERLKELASEAPTIRLVNQLFAEAVDSRASDIHIEPFDDGLVVRFRIDGHLVKVRALPISQAAAVVSRVKIVAKLDIGERRLPQDGRIRTSIRGVEIDLRVSTVPSLHGEAVVVRLLDRRGVELSLPSLGFAPDTRGTLQSMIREPGGIVLVAGPTGSGKTTTLYAALGLLNEPRRKIITVEDPVEYHFPGINQIQVHPAIGLDFAASLRAILRQDPDVIMIGEIRDLETARIAAQASLTGHLVLSTVHTNSAAATLTRLADLGLEDYLIASTLRGVLAQRLVRKLCIHCAAEDEAANGFEALAERAALAIGAVSFKRPVGCAHCRWLGFSGRTVLSELLTVTPEIRDHIRVRSPESRVLEAALEGGMRTLLADGLLKVAGGVTTVSEVIEAVGGA